MPRNSFQPRQHLADILTFLFAVAWASVVLLTGNHYRHSPGAEESLIAKHLARGEGFLSPMDETAHAAPTSWSPPVYPYIEAAAFRCFGIDTLHAAAALATLNAVCFGVIAVCARQIAMIAMTEISPPDLAIVCAHPIPMRFVYDYWDGETALALFMISVALAAAWGRESLRASRSAILGALLGLLSLTNASYILAYPLILLFAARRTLPREKLRAIAVALLTFIVTLIPWTARNYQEFGKLMYVRGGAQLELWNGNRPQSSGWLSPRTMVQHPFRNNEERAKLLEFGEMRYFDYCGQRFHDELRADPRHFLALTLRRISWLFLGDPGTRGWIPFPMRWGILGLDVEHLFLAGTTLFGILSVCFIQRARAPLWLLSIAVLTVAPFFITSTADRYALPLRTLLCVLSAITLAEIRSIMQRRRASARGFPIEPFGA
jgi:hypothetical protein